MKAGNVFVLVVFSLAATNVSPLKAPLTTCRLFSPQATSLLALGMTSQPSNGADRRVFLSNSARVSALATLFPSTISLPSFATSTTASSAVDYRAVAQDIEDFIKEDKTGARGPTLVRLAWHSSGTYDKMSKTGGSEKGTIRFPEELAHGANGGLTVPLGWLEPIHERYSKDGLSYADLFTLAGVVAIKTSGGPTIPWKSGRVDSMDPSDVTPNGRLPDADVGPEGADPSDAAHLRTIFYRMGFNDQEIVALSGAHSMGRAHRDSSGYQGPWTFTPDRFSNFFFIFLEDIDNSFDWREQKDFKPFQYQSKKGFLMMLPSDIVLMQDDKFKSYVKQYASSSSQFREDFAAAFQKLEELGTSNLVSVKWT
jgi:cytochrome c peroxidase